MGSTPLKKSQIRTLRDVARQPDGRINNLTLCGVQHGVDPAYSQMKLLRLKASGHLREVTTPSGRVFELTDAGEQVLGKAAGAGPQPTASQIRTLQAVLAHPDGYIRVVELAELQGIKDAAAERKLRLLVRSGHLRRTSRRPYGPVYVVTDLGKNAVTEVDG